MRVLQRRARRAEKSKRRVARGGPGRHACPRVAPCSSPPSKEPSSSTRSALRRRPWPWGWPARHSPSNSSPKVVTTLIGVPRKLSGSRFTDMTAMVITKDDG